MNKNWTQWSNVFPDDKQKLLNLHFSVCVDVEIVVFAFILLQNVVCFLKDVSNLTSSKQDLALQVVVGLNTNVSVIFSFLHYQPFFVNKSNMSHVCLCRLSFTKTSWEWLPERPTGSEG